MTTARPRFAITGATGFIGRRMCRRIIGEGGEVVALVRSTSAHRVIAAAGVRPVTGDLVTGEGLREVVRGADYVVHLGGLVKSPTDEGFRRCNEEGTRRLAEEVAALTSPPPLVLCSSLAAAGPSHKGRPRREEDPPQPVSRYGRSKLAAEEAVRALSDRLPATIVRPPIVYGPGDPAFVPSLLPMVRTGVVLKAGFGPRGYSLVHVDDVCEALLAAALRGRRLSVTRPSDGVYTVSDGITHTWEDLCAALARALGRRRRPLVLPVPLPLVGAVARGAELVGRVRGVHPPLNRDKAVELRSAWWTCSTERARRELGFVPTVRLEEGLADLLAW
ncbi:NAD(P)-dependent oxidoreductase [Streptomyces scopuliridis]|uniref:NAD(P)-dependent oxidoreductase n=1 Tax=Streptomyces scopuliridis TaxID=452529 RepID=A0ACD4ZWN4_9ACTN|nr:NAD(P)-dependent oxidoreductase [Streptomyces scopuliridis]WSB38267.1 NAD(P)-dependent oxidoreductase [Streptomyces scopuliridis]WSC02703.1 NAD(P)-dependent oxidoreductase [Streptomyces scopuliridis]WSC03765.1 NAD(P)-dependent oxidoreductase [Streptomyces scopuliridis]